MRAASEYVSRLSFAVGKVLTLADLDQAFRAGLRAGSLGHSEIAAALAYAAQHWDEWWVPPALPDEQ